MSIYTVKERLDLSEGHERGLAFQGRAAVTDQVCDRLCAQGLGATQTGVHPE